MTALTSLGLFIFSVICYTIKELAAHGKLKWATETYGGGLPKFWEQDSWMRKYKKDKINTEAYKFEGAPNNWYYRFFKIKYKERFPGSATIFVTLTDGFHLMQFLFKLFLIGSLVSYKEMVNPWIDGLIYFGIWQLVFNVVYRELSK